MQYINPHQPPINYPPLILQFKNLLNELKDSKDPKHVMVFYTKSLSSTASDYPEEYKLRSNVSYIVKNIIPHIDSYLKVQEMTKIVFTFLENAMKCIKINKETEDHLFSIIIKTAELDDPQILQYSSHFLQAALGNSTLFTFMFTKERLAQVFQDCFCFFPNTRLFYGPLILAATSTQTFTRISNLPNFMEKVKVLLHDGNIEPKSSGSAFSFIGLVIRSLDTGNFLPDILPYVVEIAPLCDDLSFLQYFIQAPTSNPNAIWDAIQQIIKDSNMTKEAMNTVILAIDQTGKVPPPDQRFSFAAFIPLFDSLSKPQQNILLALLKKCSVDKIANFLISSLSYPSIKFDSRTLIDLCQNVEFGKTLPILMNEFIIKQKFENDDYEYLKVDDIILKQANQTYRPTEAVFTFFFNIALVHWDQIVESIFNSIFMSMKSDVFMPSLVKFLRKGLPDHILDYLTDHLFVHQFAHQFIDNKGFFAFNKLIKTPSGRDFIARLSFFHPNSSVNQYFYENPPSDLTEEEIKLMMYGLKHDATDFSQGYLCIPSLIPFVTTYSLRTPLEKYIVGSAAGKYFLPLKSHFSNYLSTYISPIWLRYQFQNPLYLPHITDPEFSHFNIIQSTPVEMMQPSRFRRFPTFGFWFNISEQQGETATIVAFNGGALQFDRNCYLHFCGESMFCTPNKWHSFSIITSNDGLMSFYVDAKSISKYKPVTESVPYFSFGNSGLGSMTYFLSPYLKSLSTPLSQEQVEQFHQNGPQSPSKIKIDAVNGLHYVISDGLPKYLATVDGPFFVFDVAMKTTNLSQFMNCLTAAFNLLEQGFIEKGLFIDALCIVLLHQNRFEDEVIQLLRERILNDFEIQDVCMFLNDYMILTTKAESLLTVAPLDSTSAACNIHFFYVIEAFCFFDLDQEIEDSLFNVLKYYIEFDDLYVKKLLVYLYALPHIESADLMSIDDDTSYRKQIKLIDLFFTCISNNNIQMTISELTCSMTLLNPVAGAEFFYRLALYICKKNVEFSIINKIDAFLISIAHIEKAWITLFILLTKTPEYNTFSEFELNQNDLVIVNSSVLEIICQLIASTLFTNDLAFRALKFIFSLLNANREELLSQIKAVQYLCSLGTFHQTMAKSSSATQLNSAPMVASVSVPSKLTSISLGSRRGSTFFSKDLFKASKHTPPNQPKHQQKFLQAAPSPFKVNDMDVSYINHFDPYIKSHISDFINSNRITENDINNDHLRDLSFDFDDLDFERDEKVKLILDLAANCLVESTVDVKTFEMNLVHLALSSSNIDKAIMIKLHRALIFKLLNNLHLLNSPNCYHILITFIACRIQEGLWALGESNNSSSLIIDDYIDDKDIKSNPSVGNDDENETLMELFTSIISDANEFDPCYTNLIFAVFKMVSRSYPQLTQMKTLFERSQYYQVFQANKTDFNAYLFLIGEGRLDSKSEQRINEFVQFANQNSAFIEKERSSIMLNTNIEYERRCLYKRQIIDSANIRRIARFQFFWHLNTCALYKDRAASTIHLQHLKQKFTIGVPPRSLVGTSSSPLCVPSKLLPSVYAYDNRCQKMTKLIDIPRSYRYSKLKSRIPELNAKFSAPYGFRGWKLPIYSKTNFIDFIKLAFDALPNINPFEGQMLGTTEACECVVVLSAKSISVILNCKIDGTTPDTENLCHYPLYEETMAGYFGKPTLFFSKPAFTIPLSQITMVFPRRYLHSATGLEFFTISGIQISLVLHIEDKKVVINHLRPKYQKKASTGPLYAKQLLMKPASEVAKKWADGSISSFEYLLYLNYTGNRSFADFSQYPVFPWIANDYNTTQFPPSLRDFSKPLGQLSPERREQYNNMFIETGRSYFYGTHYSNPAGVLHYMMRTEPFTLFNVVLHTGFDHRDRLFSSIFETWLTCSEQNMTELRELIPQFFSFPLMFENVNKLQLQTRSDGTDINNVRLPPWAPTNTTFINRHRQLLESKMLAKLLPLWIDLIFGYKQRGQPAVEAKNLFLPISYDYPGAKNDFVRSNALVSSSSSVTSTLTKTFLGSDTLIDIDNTEVQLTNAEIDTILNFGQCPLQILATPHIQRTTNTYTNIENSIGRHAIIKKFINPLKAKRSTDSTNSTERFRSLSVDDNELFSFTSEDSLDSFDDLADDEFMDNSFHYIAKQIELNESKWKIIINSLSKDIQCFQGHNWMIGNHLLSITERGIKLGSSKLINKTLIDVVDVVVSRDETLLTIITSFGQIDTYSILYNQLELISSSCIPDIIPLVAVDVSSQFSIIVVSSLTHIAVIDLGTGFLLSKRHESFDKVAFDETHDFIVASSTATNEISYFSLTLDLICRSKYVSTPESDSSEDEITAIATTDSNHWDPTPYFVTGHKDGSVNVWHVDTAPSLETFEKYKELQKDENNHISIVEPTKKADKDIIPGCIMSYRQLVKADNPIDSVIIFSKGKALAYVDSQGIAGVISICDPNRKKKSLLKLNSFGGMCTVCGENLSNPKPSEPYDSTMKSAFTTFQVPHQGNVPNNGATFCSVCGLPVCKNCMHGKPICPLCQKLLKNRDSCIIDNLDGITF